MQVRKFEANTMQEALRMIKNQLGPDAIILSAKDVQKGFGLAGQTSVEVTAAVSEMTLRKKQIAEAKLREVDKRKYEQISARKQKQFIEKVLEKMEQNHKPVPRITSTQYIDISDDDGEELSTDSLREQLENRVVSAEMRIRSAVAEASKAADELAPPPPPKVAKRVSITKNVNVEDVRAAMAQNGEQVPIKVPVQNGEDSPEILALKNEIRQLKSVIAEFKRMPQTFITMHPGASDGIPYELSFMYEKLSRAGISTEYICEILNLARQAIPSQQLKKESVVNAWVARYILDHVNISSGRAADRFQVFVGPSGQGKTSSLVKLASHLVICERRPVAIVTTDTSKVGGAEQLRIFAKILNVPFARVRKPGDWEKINQALKSCENIFVDTAGSSLKSMVEVDNLREMLPNEVGGTSIHYTTSVLAKDAESMDVANRYKSIGVKDIIFTGLDEAVQHGLIYNMQRQLGLPIHSFGIGPNIPEDFEPATKERVVDLIFKLTKLTKERGIS